MRQAALFVVSREWPGIGTPFAPHGTGSLKLEFVAMAPNVSQEGTEWVTWGCFQVILAAS